MEAEYGQFFLSNYQYQPYWSAGGSEIATGSRAAEESARPARTSQAASSPAAQPTAVRSSTSSGSGQSSFFRLAPPPAPAATCAVGYQSSEVAVIESLVEEKVVEQAIPVKDEKEFVGPVAFQDDDEELLLGGDGAAPLGALQRRRLTVPDGVDSASESEADVGGSGSHAPSRSSQPSFLQPSAPQPLPQQQAPATPAKVPPLAVSSVQAAQQRGAPVAAAGTGGSGTPLAAPRGGQAPAEALCTPRGPPPASASAPAASPPQAQAPPPSPSPADWGKQFGTMTEIDSQVNMSLDRFFSDDRLWQRVAKEVSGTSAKIRSCVDVAGSRFRVQVPKPYPGVQYRKSKSLDDRYPRYAKHGCVVVGQVEDDGEWLRISGDVFLPMKVGNISILEPLPREGAREGTEEEGSARWWACGQSGGEPVAGSKDAEVVVNQGANLNAPEVTSPQLPWEDPSPGRRAAGGSGGGGTGAAPREQEQEPLSPEARARSAALAARSLLPGGALPGNQLSSLEAADRLLADPINPFSDTPRGGSPADSPLRSRPVSIHA